ncbi:MAG: hypothetical protein FWC98_05245 [Bacteroidales bacterium]|nr:hypothetical protein [Bacteroidales bacterium]
MTFQNRLSALVKLGVFLNEQLHSENTEFANVLTRANQENPWFTEENIRFALNGITSDLDEKNLNSWTSHYPLLQENSLQKTIAVIMAGNLPLVGFRDFLAVLISGHNILCKLSSKDSVLLKFLAEKLIQIEPKFAAHICFEKHVIKNFDAVIATGGYHAVGHFHEYFSKYPHIIRGHRNSCAILDGNETPEELRGLFEDMFRYFGLGCRNVTKLFLPNGEALNEVKNYDFQPLVEAVKNQKKLYENLAQHHLYQNNFQYQKVVSALSSQKTTDANVFLLIENSSLTPPISVVHYEYYSNLTDVEKKLNEQKNQIQCIVSHEKTPFGHAQKPTLFDYADGIDTMDFLNGL